MSENIELCSFKNIDESDTEEYHEINEDMQHETVFMKKSVNPPDHCDFFTKYDVSIYAKKVIRKKKKLKKKKSTELLDIVTSEIATIPVPLVESVLTRVEYDENFIKCHLIEAHRDWRTIAKLHREDMEHGWKGTEVVSLSPIFPRVLQNVIVDNNEIPVEYVEPAMYSDLLSNIDKDDHQSSKFLGIAVKNINFKHHHEFSLEKLLSVKLNELFEEYNNNIRSLKEIARDIKVNRETKNNLIEDITKATNKKRDDVRFDSTVREYTGKMLLSKEKYKDLIKKQKEVIHKIISVWSDLEMVREKKGFTLTPYVLEVKERDLQGDDEKLFNELLKSELTDALDRIEYEFVSKCIEYKEIKAKEKSEKATKTSITKPKLIIDEEALKGEAEELVSDIVASERIDLNLKKDINIFNSMKETKKYQFFFEMYVDNVFVCQSEHYSSSDIDTIEFTETFSIQIVPNNKVLTIVLCENNEKVSFLVFNLLEITISNEDAGFSKKQFLYETTVKSSSKCVGSGVSIKEIAAINKVRLKSSNLFKKDLVTVCEVDLKIGWNKELNENLVESVKSSMEFGRRLKRLMHGIDKVNIETMQDIISKIYGKNIREDEKIINTLQDLCKCKIKDADTIPFDEASPEFVRIKLLLLRNNGGFANIENKMVPIHASQISTEQLSCLQKFGQNDFNMDYFTDKQVGMYPLELQRFVSAKYMEKLNKNMLKNLDELLLKKTHKDVVRDVSLRSIFSRDNSISLASVTNITKQQIFKESLNKEEEISVTIIRAFNLLDRSSAILENGDDDGETIAGYKVRPLRPFVHVSYHGDSVQTVTSIGCHPSWNHTLRIKTILKPLSSLHINVYDEYKVNITGAYSDEEHSNKTVHYRYYNKWLGTLEVPISTVLSLGTLKGTFKIATPPVIFGYESAQIKESSSLIPEINQLLKKDTSFITLQITTSLSNLGGLHDYNLPIPSGIEDDYVIKHLNNILTEYINDFPSRSITLTFIDSTGANKCVTQFLQAIPPPNQDCFPKNPKTCESALSKSSGVSKSSSSKSSGRRKEIDLEKGSPIVEKDSLYSTREGSWKTGDNLTKAVNGCLRYVALIPSYDVTETHAVTLMGLELLKVLHGSPLDHTILLASFFLYLGIKFFISIGVGLPRGRSSYVLIKYNKITQKIVQVNDLVIKKGIFGQGDGCVWYVCDAVSGERHELRDVGSPMKTVEYVFDNENIWLNMQPSQDCDCVSFDFSRSSDWQPVFDKSIFVMQQLPVSEIGLYSAPHAAEDLRQNLEARIKRKVQKWRPHMKTVWNRYCSGVLRDMLPHWEYWAFNPSENKPIVNQKLKQLMVTYKIFGFPLNMPFVSTKCMTSRVKSTGLHLTDEPGAEFALAVDVFSYPNNVVSVWVYIATISRI
ncbi:hypothetical protein O3G_MSEX009995 [Manduca sexta]|uniref:C2 domain-containing protein n=1 Tax=Manduca sexta TaxID=7130 RepID=A0A921ZFK6_MANSE|nr:hypothetical protein O3G_MSEX009995 [Manduca sexta]